MKALLDTNIIIHREASKVISQDIGILYRWLDRVKYTKCVHPVTISEIESYKDRKTVDAFQIKLDSYECIKIPSPLHPQVVSVSQRNDLNQNDLNDTLLLNEVFVGRVDILITEDRKIHRKSNELGVSNRVFTIDSFLEKVFSEHPDLIEYKTLNVRKLKFGQINIEDVFFSSLKEDYKGFEKWFIRKYDEDAYVTLDSDSGNLLSFLYIKVERPGEDYSDIEPGFSSKKRLKVGTFKVVNNGLRLGERFMKIIFDNAIKSRVDEIYVTIFDKRQEQKRLIELLEQWGFALWGKKGEELVYVRKFSKVINLSNLKQSYPYLSRNKGIFIVPIYPEYHTELLPDSILNTESPHDFIDDFPHRNGISKVYVSRAMLPHPQVGDVLVFYRTGGYYKSVISTIGVVQEVKYDFRDENDFISYCRKSSVFPEIQLRAMWRFKASTPFVVRFLYVYSFPHRINMKELIDLGILRGVDDPPRGFKPISLEQFNLILKATRSDESFIVD